MSTTIVPTSGTLTVSDGAESFTLTNLGDATIDYDVLCDGPAVLSSRWRPSGETEWRALEQPAKDAAVAFGSFSASMTAFSESTDALLAAIGKHTPPSPPPFTMTLSGTCPDRPMPLMLRLWAATFTLPFRRRSWSWWRRLWRRQMAGRPWRMVFPNVEVEAGPDDACVIGGEERYALAFEGRGS